MAEPEWLAEAEEVPEDEAPDWASEAEEVTEPIPAAAEFAADPPAPEQAPAPAPNVSMSPGWRLPLQGMTLGWGDEAVAAAKSALGDRTYEQELARERARLAAERETSPNPELAEFAGGLPLAALPIGQATSIPRMAATGALTGAVAGAGSSDAPTQGGRLGAALRGGAVGGALGGGVGAAIKAPGAIVRKGTELLSELQSAPLSPQAADTARSMTALTPQGRALRASARRGEVGRDDLSREITSLLTKGEEAADVVMNYGKVGLKKGPVERSLSAAGVDDAVVHDAASDALTGAQLRVFDLEELAGERTPVGKTALRQAREAIEAFGPDSGGTAADRYVRLDELKRRVGRAVKQAGRGANRDVAAQEGLKRVYEELRHHLEDASVWGGEAAAMQREINQAWVPWLEQRGHFERQLLTRTGKRGVDPWTDIPEGDPSKVSALMKGVDAPEQDLRLRALRQGSEAQERLMGTLAEKYEAPPGVMKRVVEAKSAGGQLRDLVRRAERDASSASALRDLADESKERGFAFLPKASTVARGLSRYEAQLGPRHDAIMRGLRRAGRGIQRGVQPSAASLGKDTGLRHRVRSTTDTARELVSTPSRDLLSLGQAGISLQRAAAKGDQEFNSEHWRLMMSSPEYRAKMRELEEKRTSEDTQ